MGVGSNTKSSNPLLPVTWGSENTYRLLSSFRMWAESNIFLPVEENPVKIKIDVTDQIPINFPTCHECKLKLNQAGIVDAIKVVHWKQVHTFNLISIVRCKFAFVVVGTCVLCFCIISIQDRRLHLYKNNQKKKGISQSQVLRLSPF